jgi:hypothetical protein
LSPPLPYLSCQMPAPALAYPLHVSCQTTDDAPARPRARAPRPIPIPSRWADAPPGTWPWLALARQARGACGGSDSDIDRSTVTHGDGSDDRTSSTQSRDMGHPAFEHPRAHSHSPFSTSDAHINTKHTHLCPLLPTN